ncbi:MULTISPECIES: alpha/beta hydrolase [Streptomyces]|uniref:Alpha/beta hydrolase n=1 Tax=Streptomyces koelreuteriae TaxID=2838015 RepID=A0ABX8G1T0_9ACTN|nr:MULTISPECIES: alpha/beta hydrolase [Streptomyces]QWB27329.1 alpha/beta hydrolase [Streptomyces koelreuteriae]UUA10413.1 alpha/beta hydrolase [Streptomyces koelreuteriae]UUA18020.1 alpha/beta hydrolase [Streptomyces sp. CRCS-T-1]
MRRRRLAPLLAVGVTATLAPALATPTATAAPAAATPSTASSSAASKVALDRYVKQKPRWKRCEADAPAEFECATIKVPLDYRAPGGKRIDLAISRIKSTAPDQRRGVLLSNPGGPGGPGLYMPLGMQERLPASALAKYDLIGFDPRGVGRSSPVSCGLEPEEENWLRPYKAETFDKDVAWARDVATKCEEKAGDTLAHITTRNTARDMDLLRAILGEKKISYVGYSYGTYLGAVYTQLFPGRTDRFVLDSAVDPARAWRGMIQWWAEGAEPAFDRWTGWAAERSETYGLGDTPKKVDRTFWDLVAQADEKPIELEGQPVTGDDIRSGMRGAVFSPREATEAIVELRKAASGEPASAKKLAAFAGSERPGTAGAGAAADAVETPSDNMTASFWAVACGDNSAAWSRDPESYRRDAIEDKGRYPLYGDFASSIKPCAFWDKSVEPATKVNNKVRSLVVQNEWDSQTPLPSGQALHAALKGSKMLTVLGGEGHGVYPNGNACTDGTVTGYLLTGKLPAKDVTCEATAESNAEARKNQQRDALPGSPLPDRAPDRF